MLQCFDDHDGLQRYHATLQNSFDKVNKTYIPQIRGIIDVVWNVDLTWVMNNDIYGEFWTLVHRFRDLLEGQREARSDMSLIDTLFVKIHQFRQTQIERNTPPRTSDPLPAKHVAFDPVAEWIRPSSPGPSPSSANPIPPETTTTPPSPSLSRLPPQPQPQPLVSTSILPSTGHAQVADFQAFPWSDVDLEQARRQGRWDSSPWNPPQVDPVPFPVRDPTPHPQASTSTPRIVRFRSSRVYRHATTTPSPPRWDRSPRWTPNDEVQYEARYGPRKPGLITCGLPGRTPAAATRPQRDVDEDQDRDGMIF